MQNAANRRFLKIVFSYLFFFSYLGGEEKVLEKSALINEVVTDHKVSIGGNEIAYQATCATLPLKDNKGNVKASLFFIAYTRNDTEPGKRPLAFCFNGGPGSSSVWLHMGVLGPKRVVLEDLKFNAPPYGIIDNEYSLLDVADLVFIDPISTGYSREAPNEDAKQFHGVEEDVQWLAEFVRLYTTHYARWDCPKYLIGESYGTARATAMAEYLHDQFHLYLNGIVLVSSVLDFQTLHISSKSTDLSFLLYLPTYTAAAWYHKVLPEELLKRDLRDVLEESKNFATDDYAKALFEGSRLSEEKKKKLVDRLSQLTGLSAEFIKNANFRVSIYQFVKELMRTKDRVIGRMDARYVGIDSNRLFPFLENDPSLDAIFGVFTGSFNQYVRKNLNWIQDEDYKILTDVQPWNYGNGNCFLNVAPVLKKIMHRNPKLKVLIANSYYDLATPFFASQYTLDHLNVDPEISKNIEMTYYEAGHMMYTHKPSLVHFSQDLKNFFSHSSLSAAENTGASSN